MQAWQDGWTVTDGVNAVADGIRLASTLLGLGRLKIHKSCKSLLDAIPGYSWSETHAERGEDLPVKVDDHAVDALRYGIATTRAMWQQWIPVAAWRNWSSVCGMPTSSDEPPKRPNRG